MLKPIAEHHAVLVAPPCCLGAVWDGDVLVRLDFLPPDATPHGHASARARQLADQLDAYWQTPSHVFDLPHRADGTVFRQRVWQALCAIPPGAPRCYGDLAKALGSAARAVGQACGSNPLPLVIPCHRVVGANGLGGFMHHGDGKPLELKRWLLDHEARVVAVAA